MSKLEEIREQFNSNPDWGVYDGMLCRSDLALLLAEVERKDREIEQLKKGNVVSGETSDGYHTFNELYKHRAYLFATIVNQNPDLSWKSKKHDDGTMFDGMFIVGIETRYGQATYHYDLELWNLYNCKELNYAPKWDGHTSDEAIERILTLGKKEITP